MNSASSPDEIARLSRKLYVSGPLVARAMQHYRPYISPFGNLLDLVPKNSRVLDVGCGGGLFLGLLCTTGRITQGIGIDTSPTAIAAAQAMVQRLPFGHSLRFEARSAATPLPEGTYDVVSLLDVMHHIAPPQQRLVLDQALSRVAQGGSFLYKDMVSRPIWRATANRLHDLVVARQWINYLPLERVIAWALEGGFALELRQEVDMLWYGHEIVRFRRLAAG